MKIKRMLCGLVALLIASHFIVACGGGSGDPEVIINDEFTRIWDECDVIEPKTKKLEGPKLVPFDDCGEVEAEVKAMLIAEVKGRSKRLLEQCKSPSDGSDDAIPVMGSPGDAATETSFTDTNIQEEGVDEADLIKTDGKYVYSIVGDKVEIVKVWPFNEFGKVASIEQDLTPHGLYLADDRLVVISESASNWNVSNGKFKVSVYDVTNPALPELVTGSSYLGDFIDSRRVGEMLHLVFNATFNVGAILSSFDFSIDWDLLPACGNDPSREMLAAVKKTIITNIRLIDNADIIELIPEKNRNNSCTDLMRSHVSYGESFLTVASDDISDDKSDVSMTSILGMGGVVYTSLKNIFIASGYNPFMSVASGGGNKTVVHQFSLGGSVPAYSGSNSVDGHLVDSNYIGSRHSDRFSMAQFAMSEYDGSLRVATTLGYRVNNLVTLLDVDSPELDEISRVEDLGTGERIYAVRFIGPKGYVVTFKKVDPLYVLDLRDSSNPVVAGELKVPGFSTYLHPLDEERLVGLGFDADDQGNFAWTQGLKLAIFDVSVPANPTEVGNRVVGDRGTYSAAIEEHHAFNLDKERGLIALPIDYYEGEYGGSGYGKFVFSGVMVFNIDDDGSFTSFGDIKLSTSSTGTWSSTNILRTIMIGNGADEGIVTLTKSNVFLHQLGPDMTELGKIN